MTTANSSEKQAYSPGGQAMVDFNDQAITSNYYDLVKKVLLGTVAAGGAIRGGQGLVNMMRRNMAPKRKPVPTAFSLPSQEPMEEPMSYGKAAATPLTDAILGVVKKPFNSFGDWIQSKGLDSMSQKPEFWAGLSTAGAGGLYAGYKGVDAIMQNRRQAEIEAEEEAARQEYEKSLSGMASKRGSDEQFEKLYQSKEAILKESEFDLSDPKQLGALALGAWPAMALASGAVTYNIANSRRPSNLLDKALKQRRRQQLADAPVFAYTNRAEPSPEGIVEDADPAVA